MAGNGAYQSMETREKPIGIFDSGMGGLTVLREIIRLLPFEHTLYYADAAHCPYGEKSREEVINYTETGIRFLINQGAKLIVVACNTASSSAISYLRNKYDIDFVAMEPAIKPAVTSSETGVIGVLATRRTLEGEPLKRLCQQWEGKARIIFQPGCGLVELVENSRENSPEARELLGKYIEKIASQGADRIVLGCTHYPFLAQQMKNIIGKRDIRLIDPAPAIALRVKQLLNTRELLNLGNVPAKHEFHSSLDEKYNDTLRLKLEWFSEEHPD